MRLTPLATTFYDSFSLAYKTLPVLLNNASIGWNFGCVHEQNIGTNDFGFSFN
jgi:hypothetical protein